MRMEDSLLVIWAFESPSLETLRKNIIDVYQDVPRTEQPDFVIVPKCRWYNQENIWSCLKLVNPIVLNAKNWNDNTVI